MTEKRIDNLSELFEKCSCHIFDCQRVYLKGTNYLYLVGRNMWARPSITTLNKIKLIPFETVLDNSSDEIRDILLFHLDIFLERDRQKIYENEHFFRSDVQKR